MAVDWKRVFCGGFARCRLKFVCLFVLECQCTNKPGVLCHLTGKKFTVAPWEDFEVGLVFVDV